MVFSIEHFHQIDLSTTNRAFAVIIHRQRIRLNGVGPWSHLTVKSRRCWARSNEWHPIHALFR